METHSPLTTDLFSRGEETDHRQTDSSYMKNILTTAATTSMYMSYL